MRRLKTFTMCMLRGPLVPIRMRPGRSLRAVFRLGAAAAGLALLAPTPASASQLGLATPRICAPVTFKGVADFRLIRIRATGVSCSTARRVVRGARLHEHWHSLGFACKVTGYEPEVATFYRCTKGPSRIITFKAGYPQGCVRS